MKFESWIYLVVLVLMLSGCNPDVKPSVATSTPTQIEKISQRIADVSQSLYNFPYETDIKLDAKVFTLNVVSEEERMDSFSVEEDLTEFLELILVECETYNRNGRGLDGCRVQKNLPFQYVEINLFDSKSILVASVKYEVGLDGYFAGIDGAQIIEIYDYSSEYYLIESLRKTGWYSSE